MTLERKGDTVDPSWQTDIKLADLRVAIVHYWFVGRAGGERVVEALAEIFPQADLFCLIADPETLSPALRRHPIKTSLLQKLPGARRYHRHFLLLQPLALEQFDFTGYDLVISSESGPAKGVITSSQTCHVCYCHSPMRYIWDMYPSYRQNMNPVTKTAFTLAAHYLRLWDYASAGRVDYFVANSRFIASRIWKNYRRESTVIYPPVETSAGHLESRPEDFYLAVGRLVDYKRFDLAVLACTRLGKRLKVVGAGPQAKMLRSLAGPTVEFLGSVDDAVLRENMSRCRALLFPGEEDFGIVPVEVQSFGRPVVAYGAGGALETVRGLDRDPAHSDSPSGVFFGHQTVESLQNAILRFEAAESRFSPQSIRDHALQFDREIFKTKIADYMRLVLKDFRNRWAR